MTRISQALFKLEHSSFSEVGMREKDIRPEKLSYYNSDVLYPRALKKFLKKWRSKFILFKKCLACKHKKIATIIVKDGFRFQKCKKCGFVFINPRPPLLALSDWYCNADHCKIGTKLLRKTEEKRLPIFKKRLKIILNVLKRMERLKKKKLKIIEIGASLGSLLKILNKVLKGKHDLFGVEPDPEACSIAKKAGLKMFNGAVEDFIKTNKKSYDLICCFETIEHLFDPANFIKYLNTLLNNSGIIYMTTPNYYGYDFLTLGEKYKNFYGPNHLNYFNKKSIENLLNNAGFKLIHYKTSGILDVDIVQNYFKRNDIEIDSFWKYIFEFKNNKKEFLGDFQKLLIKHGLSGSSEFLAVKERR